MRKIIVATVLALMLVVSAAVPAFAETTADVTVTATPAIVSIDLGVTTDWTMNDSTASTPGDDAIRKATTYYSNDADNTVAPSATVLDGECRFTVTNDGTVAVNIEISMSDFTGGTDPMTNGDSGSAGVGTFGAKAYVSGALLSAALAITVTGTANVITNLASAGTKNWGLQVATQTDDFTDSTSTTSTVTLTATETP